MEKYLNVDRAVAVNPVTYMGAEPVFMDCGDDINIDPDKLESFLDNECKMVDATVINKKTDKKIDFFLSEKTKREKNLYMFRADDPENNFDAPRSPKFSS
jgi:hypothetical protein